MRIIILLGLAATLLLAVLVYAANPARPHEAPSGWAYPINCCSKHDCRPLTAGEIVYTPDGWRFTATGETFAENTARPSPDGQSHACFAKTMNGERVRQAQEIGGTKPCFWIGEGKY